MKAFYHILTLACLVIVLSLLGFVGWMAAAGRFNADSGKAVSMILRGEKVFPEPEPEQPATRPATRPATVSSQADLAMSEQAVMRIDLLTRRSREELRYKQQQLENLLGRIKAERELLARERMEWAEQIRAVEERKQDDGFQRELAMYQKMDARKAKEVLFGLPEETAARFLAEMKAQTRAEIVSAVRGDMEQAKLQRILTLMREV